MIDFPSTPAVNQQYTFGGRTWYWTGAAWRAAVNSVQLALDAKAPQDISGVSDAVVDGSEKFPIWKGSFLKTSVSAIFSWFRSLANSWTGQQQYQAGVSFGSAINTSNSVFSRHIALYGTTYGLGVTGGRLNYVADATASHVFMHAAADTMSVSAASGLVVANRAAISGGVQLGELSPTIKCKVVEGTVSTSAGGRTDVAHGLASGDVILGVLGAVQHSAQSWVTGNSLWATYQCGFSWGSTVVSVTTHVTASADILGKKVRFTILYTA